MPAKPNKPEKKMIIPANRKLPLGHGVDKPSFRTGPNKDKKDKRQGNRSQRNRKAADEE